MRAIVSALSLALLSATLVAAVSPIGSVGAQQASDYGAQVVNGINAQRQAAGLWPLRSDSRLASAAATHDQVMDSQQCFSHQCTGELDLGTRVDATGYPWWRLGETIALNTFTPADTVAAWMASDGVARVWPSGVASRNEGTAVGATFGAAPERVVSEVG